MAYRKFRLLNGVGSYFDLTEKSFKVFANEPQGLGFTKTVSVMRLGDYNYVPYSIVNLDTISFEILFYDENLNDKYQKYDDFIKFISYKPLYLLYQKPNTFRWYRRSIESMSITKSEVQRDQMLHCNFSMQTLSFWEDDEVQIITVKNESSVGEDKKIYPITYPFKYGGNQLDKVVINSSGTLSTPIEITIDGTVTNPQYILHDGYSGDVYGRGKFNGTFDYVYVNSLEIAETIELIQNGGAVSNPYRYQDFSIGSPNEIQITFLKLNVGQSYFQFLVNDGFDGTITLKWRNRYVSV